MRVTKKDALEQVLKLLEPQKVPINIVLRAPNERQIQSALRSGTEPSGLSVTIMKPLGFYDARNTRDGSIVVEAVIDLLEIELNSIVSLELDANGGYSFVAIQLEEQYWEYNYNAGTGRSRTWTTRKFIIANDGRGTYEVLKVENLEGRF